MGGTRDRKLVIKDMKPVYRRLKSKNGETLVETLAATLLVSLAMIAFSVMLSSTANIITTSRDTINQYINIKSESYAAKTGPKGKVEIRGDSNEPVKFTDGSEDRIDITADVFERGNNIKIVSFHKTIAD